MKYFLILILSLLSFNSFSNDEFDQKLSNDIYTELYPKYQFDCCDTTKLAMSFICPFYTTFVYDKESFNLDLVYEDIYDRMTYQSFVKDSLKKIKRHLKRPSYLHSCYKIDKDLDVTEGEDYFLVNVNIQVHLYFQ